MTQVKRDAGADRSNPIRAEGFVFLCGDRKGRREEGERIAEEKERDGENEILGSSFGSLMQLALTDEIPTVLSEEICL